MSRGMYARRTDANHSAIVAYLRSLGASVRSLAPLGKGCPDLLIGIYGITTIAEVKDGLKPPSSQKLTQQEKEFQKNWRGDYHIIRDKKDANKLISLLINRYNVLKKWEDENGKSV